MIRIKKMMDVCIVNIMWLYNPFKLVIILVLCGYKTYEVGIKWYVRLYVFHYDNILISVPAHWWVLYNQTIESD